MRAKERKGIRLSEEKSEKKRLSVTMTKAYVDAMDTLIEEGLYLTRGEIILEALRMILKRYGIEPFLEPLKAKE